MIENLNSLTMTSGQFSRSGEEGSRSGNETRNQPQSILSIEARDSKRNNFIQPADMVSGAIARSFYPENTHHGRWVGMLKLNKSDVI